MKSIFILTGAGISAESGIQTFRGSDGLWEGHRLEDVTSPGGFQRDPQWFRAWEHSGLTSFGLEKSRFFWMRSTTR